MPSRDKNVLLADEILRILKNGLPLSSDVVNYIDATFSNPTIEELENILQDDSNCEKDSLVELLFFPDEYIQVQLEEILENHSFEQEDEEKVSNYLCRKPLAVSYNFPHDRGSFNLEMHEAAAHQFIKRLNISTQIDARLIASIKKDVSETRRKQLTVRIRNSRFSASDNALDFLCSFFEKWNMESGDVTKHLDFALSLLEELHENTDIFAALMKKKRFYLKHLKRTEKFEEQLLKSNMETLMLEGKIYAFIDKNEAREKMETIDRISNTVFGKTEYYELPSADEKNMNFHPAHDIQAVLKKLS